MNNVSNDAHPRPQKYMVLIGVVIVAILFIAHFATEAGKRTLTVRLNTTVDITFPEEKMNGKSCTNSDRVASISGNVVTAADESGREFSRATVPDSGKVVQFPSFCQYVVKLRIPKNSNNIEVSDGENVDKWISATDLATSGWDLELRAN